MENIPNSCLVLCLKQIYHSEIMDLFFLQEHYCESAASTAFLQSTKVMIYLHNVVGNFRFYKLFPKSLQNVNLSTRM